MKKQQDKSGFKIPEGYFESFQEKLQHRLQEPGAHLPGDAGFKVPEGYFGDFHKRMEERLDTTPPTVIPLYPYKKWMLVAASVAAIIGLLVLIPGESSGQPGFGDLAGVEIANYMEYNEVELSDDEIAQLLPLEDLVINDMLENNLNEENIIEYLDNSVEDYEDLNMDIDE